MKQKRSIRPNTEPHKATKTSTAPKVTKITKKAVREDFEASLSFEEVDNRFLDIFRNHDFADFPHEKRRQLVKFYRLLLEDQKRHNSTRLHTIRDVGIKHFIDSLIVPRLTKLSFPLLDVGTGPGFPGIPLKILYPNEKIILAEGVQKRVEFLKRVRDELELENLDIIGRKIDAEFAYPIQGVITRAFDDLNDTLRDIQLSLQPGGKAFFMKGPAVDPEIARAKDRFRTTYKLLDDISYKLPQTQHQRRLVVFEKLPMTKERT